MSDTFSSGLRGSGVTLAVPPPSQVIQASDELAATVANEGLLAPTTIYETMALSRNLALAGRRAHPEREEILRSRNDERPPLTLRQQLKIHLDYWRAVNRIRTGRDEELQLEDYGIENLPACDPDEFVERASGGGINGYEAIDVTALGENVKSLVAQNCRIIRGQLVLSDVERLSLGRSSLVASRLEVSAAGLLDLSDGAMCGGTVACRATTGRFSASVLRFVTLTLDVDEADFSNVDFGLESMRKQPELLELAKSFGVGQEEEARDDPVRLVDCSFRSVTFRGALLQGVVFSNCAMAGADFEGATLDGAVFDQCDLSHVDFDAAASLDGVAVDGEPLSS